MKARQSDEIADAIREEWGPAEVDPVPVAHYLVGGLFGGVLGAFFVPVTAGFVTDAVRGDIVGGLASAMSMVVVGVFVSVIAVPVGAVVGLAAGAAGLLGRSLLGGEETWQRMLGAGIASAVVSAGAVAGVAASTFTHLMLPAVVCGAVFGGGIAGLTESVWSRAQSAARARAAGVLTDAPRQDRRWPASTWVGAGVLGTVLGLVVCTAALGLAYGDEIGDSVGVSCSSVAPPDGYPPEGLVGADRTLWPLGTACEFASAQKQSVVVPESDWTATVALLLGLAALAVGVAAAGRGVLTARRDALSERQAWKRSNAAGSGWTAR